MCIYQGTLNGEPVILVLYVDDGLILRKTKTALYKIANQLQDAFKITIGEPNHFVGLEITRNTNTGSISIGVSSYIANLLKRFNLTESKGCRIPANPSVCLTDPNM